MSASGLETFNTRAGSRRIRVLTYPNGYATTMVLPGCPHFWGPPRFLPILKEAPNGGASVCYWTTTFRFVGGFGWPAVDPAENSYAPASHAPVNGRVFDGIFG